MTIYYFKAIFNKAFSAAGIKEALLIVKEAHKSARIFTGIVTEKDKKKLIDILTKANSQNLTIHFQQENSNSTISYYYEKDKLKNKQYSLPFFRPSNLLNI